MGVGSGINDFMGLKGLIFLNDNWKYNPSILSGSLLEGNQLLNVWRQVRKEKE